MTQAIIESIFRGYFLRGQLNEDILVIRSSDPELLYKIIMRLSASRDKQIRALANKLELDYYDGIRNTSEARKENPGTSVTGKRRTARKNATSEQGSN